MKSTILPRLCLGFSLVLAACSGDYEETVTDMHTFSFTADGRMACTHGEDEIDKGTVTLPIKTGQGEVFEERYIPDSWLMKWRFGANCAAYPEFKTFARAGIQELFTQSWTNSALVPLNTWQQTEVSNGADVTIFCQDPVACSFSGTCTSFGSGGMGGYVRHLAGSSGGFNYYTVENGVIYVDVVMMTSWAANVGQYAPGYDANWVRANAFYFLTQHEMAHNLGVRHRSIDGTAKYLNDAGMFIPGVGTFTGNPSGSDHLYLTDCSAQRLRWVQPSTGTLSLNLVAVPSACPNANKF